MDKYIVNMYCGGRESGVGDPFIKAGEVTGNSNMEVSHKSCECSQPFTLNKRLYESNKKQINEVYRSIV